MKKIYAISGLIVLAVALQSSIKLHTVPPKGRTGATAGVYCTGCHTTNPLNSGGGSVTVTGLPSSGGYVAGQSYPFSITITHGAADRLRWGFSIAARNASGAAIGTFSSNNPYAAINSNTTATDIELSHLNTVIMPASNTYTFDNLIWTAPAANTPVVGPVTFYYTGNATNGNGASNGDFVYASSTSTALPIDLKDFTASVLSNSSVELKWATAFEQNSDYFEVEKSDDGQFFFPITRVIAAGNSATGRSYNYTDRSASSYNKPVFYRLKLTDKDGKFKQSKMVSVQLKNGSLYVQNVYPTLVRSNNHVTANIISDKNLTVHIDLVDLTGRLLKTYSEPITSGSNLVSVKLPANLPSEWVFARFTAPGFKQVVPLVVNE